MPWPFFTKKDASVTATITLGGTAQTLLPANKGRNRFFFQNISDTVMYVNFGATASATAGFLVPANGGVLQLPPDFCPTGLVSVFCATTGKAFSYWVA